MRSTEGELLDLTCCTIAVRHLDPHSRAVITPRLQKLTEDIILKIMHNPRESLSLEAIQSLLIVSLWAPICGYESKLKDVQSLLSTAAGMAMNIRLHEASERAIAMRESFQKDDGSFVSKEEIVDGLNRARLVRFCSFFRPIKSQAHVTDTCSGWHSRTWNHCAFVLVFFLSVWLFNVYVFAHSLCIGTLRTPLSRRTSADIHLILLTPRPPATGEECRDIRLRLGAELFDIADRQNMSEVINLEGVEPWFLSRKEALEEVNRIQRMLLPLPGKHCLVLLSLS